MQISKLSLATTLFAFAAADSSVRDHSSKERSSMVESKVTEHSSKAESTVTEHSSTVVTITECHSSVTNCPFTTRSSVNTSISVSTLEGVAGKYSVGSAGAVLAVAGGLLAL